MIRLLTICTALSLVTACRVAEAPIPSPSNGITYSRDLRTGLCFANTQSPTSSFFIVRSISEVPCTPEVLWLAGSAAAQLESH